jgi:hypothetical protein
MSESDGKQPNKTLEECLAATLNQEGVDVSLLTGLDLQRFAQYGRLRKELSEKYPKPLDQREEEEDDTVSVVEARRDAKASLFTRLMMTVKESYDRVEMLQAFASEYDKKVVRFYAHITLNWLNQGREWLKLLGDVGIFEMVEAYFKVLRKHGLSTEEEPYYFLSPEQKQNVKYAGDVLKRTTMMDENEIKLSVLEGLE